MYSTIKRTSEGTRSPQKQKQQERKNKTDTKEAETWTQPTDPKNTQNPPTNNQKGNPLNNCGLQITHDCRVGEILKSRRSGRP